MTTEQYSIGYDAGYQDGFDAAPVQPVKQEPVAWLIPGSITGDKKLAEANGDYATPLYAAPVDAKAIRAEALEEAAKVCGDIGRTMPDRDGEITEWCAAAIRARGEK